MTIQTLLKRGGVALGSIGVAAIIYQLLLRRPIMNWGATDAEANALLPGDELLEEADAVATRAITIDAPASSVWPWIAQMGPAPRGGAYTYDWIENLLRLNMHSSDRVIPEFQHPQVGDTLGYGKYRMRLERVEPRHVLATRKDSADQPQPLPAPFPHHQNRNDSDGAGIARHGTEDAAWYQATRRTPRNQRDWAGSCLRPARASRPTTFASIGEEIGIDWATSPFNLEQLRIGMNVELEHGLHDPLTNVSDDDPHVTAKIALAHLNEFPDYYTRLGRMEEEAKRDWADRSGNRPTP